MAFYVLDIETTTSKKDIRLVGTLKWGSLDEGLHRQPHFYSMFKDKSSFSYEFLLKLEAGDTVCTFNGSDFDFDVLKEVWGIDIPVLFKTRKVRHIDLYLLSKLTNRDKRSHSLAALCNEIGHEVHKPSNPEWYNTASTEELAAYLKQDLLATAKLFVHMMRTLPSYYLVDGHALKVEQEVREIINNQRKLGVHFDTEKAVSLVEELEKEMDYIEVELIGSGALPTVPIPEGKLDHPPKKQFKVDGTPSKALLSYLKKYGYIYTDIHPTGPVAIRTVHSKGREIAKYTVRIPLTEPIVKTHQLTLANQIQLKQYLQKSGWKPTMWNTVKDSKTGEVIKTSPRLTNRFTKEPCPNLEKCGFTVGTQVAKWLSLRSRRNLISSPNKTGWLHNLRDDGSLESDADTLGTPTGRFAHKGIANIPRVTSLYGKQIRELFCARPGKVWVGWDAQALESVIEAHYVYPYDKEYALSLVEGSSEDGTDIHTRTQVALDLPSRDAAKTFKYMLMYGAKPPKIAETMGVNREQAERWYSDFWKEYRGLDLLQGSLKLELKRESGCVRGLDGRMIKVRNPHAVLNYKIQSGGAILMKHAMLIANKRIKERFKYKANGLIRYHDEEQWECDLDIADAVGKIGVQSITDAGRFLKLNVPITGTYKIGDNWAQTH